MCALKLFGNVSVSLLREQQYYHWVYILYQPLGIYTFNQGSLNVFVSLPTLLKAIRNMCNNNGKCSL